MVEQEVLDKLDVLELLDDQEHLGRREELVRPVHSVVLELLVSSIDYINDSSFYQYRFQPNEP